MKLLLIGLFDNHEPQTSLRNALRGISDYYEEYNFPSYRGRAVQLIATAFKKTKFDVLFLQIQSDRILSVSQIRMLSQRGVKIFNFTGDVRQPIPKWYHELAPYVTTLFSNKTDSDLFKSLGFKSEYFQIGYNVEFYNTTGPKIAGPEIVFMGNNYPGMFPLSGLRIEMVELLQKKYGSRFGVYGNGWKGSKWLDQNTEAGIYRNCKIAINLSHFDLKRYSSDRLFRILGCGAFCLSHKFEEIEEEFTNDSDLVYWSNLEELTKLIDIYLSFEAQPIRQLIANNGNQLCEKKYTWKHRIESQLLPLINV
jgi:spore maturation protein CgeB